MSAAYWQAQNSMAVNNLMDAGAQLGANWRARREQREFDENLQVEYQAALEKAKMTGVMPEHLQSTTTLDSAIEQIGVKAVALRELGKRVPSHPLVTSPDCRKAVSTVTKILYNRANRPENTPIDDFSPDDDTAERIFEAYK